MDREVGAGGHSLASVPIRLWRPCRAGLRLGLVPKLKGIVGLKGPDVMRRGRAGGLGHSLSSG